MNKKYYVTLTANERNQLEQLVSNGRAPARKIRRARILLKSDCSARGPKWTYETICAALDINPSTVMNTCRAYTEGGLDKALSRKKPAREYKHRLDGHAEAHLIALACSEAPEGYERWTLRLLKDRFLKLEIVDSVSHETIRATLKKTNLSLG